MKNEDLNGAGPLEGKETDDTLVQEVEVHEEEGMQGEVEVPDEGTDGGETGGPAGADAEGVGAEGEPQAPDMEVLQDELARLKDQHLRLAADFENFRKRANADITAGWVRAQAELANALLEGLDDLQRVSLFTSDDATLDTLIEGVDLVERKLMKALTAAGMEVFEPAQGETFDPNTMEAMMRVPAEEEGQDDTVHQTFVKGYLFKDQLLRPARVSVYKDDD